MRGDLDLMPVRPSKPCATPGCRGLTRTPARYCTRCQAAGAGRDDRPSAASRGYDHNWRAARQQYLLRHPCCVTCLAEQGEVVPATVVDHIVPHKGDPQLFWDESNWQALCESHHNAKTAKGD